MGARQRPQRDLKNSDIAIVGMSCIFPKAPNLRQYWQNILGRLDCIREIDPARWDANTFFDEDRLARDKIYSKWGGFLESMRFDPVKWKIPPASLMSIDPIQLMSLEVANQAMIDAGWDQREFPKESTGCIFACAGSHDVGGDYAFRTMLQHYLPRVKDLTPEMKQQITDDINATLPEWSEDSFPGFLMNVIAGRIANRFDLGGPNYVVDAACAASLAALHASMGQLRLGTVDAMIVGAADGTNNPFCYMSFAKTHALSPRGKSRPFDNSADGIALGEGIAALVLRRLPDAERDGDKIYAVIKGIGASSDGRNRSMTAPHPPGQILAMKRAYEDADVPAATISLVEAHGTGTAVGDSTEITSLHSLFSQATSDEQYAAVGSVKSMIGHTKTCAGLASLVKTALALHHRVLPPTLNVEKPNEKVDFRHSPFYVNTETRPWFDELGEHPRRAGVSAFGFGGTNFHVVMEEYQGPVENRRDIDLSPRATEILFWKRATRSEIITALKALQTALQDAPVIDLAQLAQSVLVDEQSIETPSNACRLAIVATSTDDFRAKLSKAIDQLATKSTWQDPTGIYYSEAAPVAAERVAFLYPGQGSQSVNMLRDLAVASHWAQDLFASANQQLNDRFPVSLTRLIYPPPAFSPAEDEERKAKLNDTAVAQPALGLVEVFATQLMERYGIVPAAVAGHSYGEYVALHAAGVMDIDDLLEISAERGRVSADASEICPGAMAAVMAGAEKTRKLLAEAEIPAELANLNSPDQTIIAGPVDVVEKAVAYLKESGVRAKRIPVTAAFHTSALAPAAKQLAKALQGVSLTAPKKTVYSNTLAAPYPTKATEIRKLLQRHIVEPVRFEEQMQRMRADGYDVLIEVGPGRVLSGLVGRIFEGDAPTILTLDAAGRDGVTQFAHLLAQASVLGLSVDLRSWFSARGLREIGTETCVSDAKAAAKPKLAEWVISVAGAKPVTPLPTRRGSPGEGLRAKFGGKTGTVNEIQEEAITHSANGLNGSNGKGDKHSVSLPVAKTAPANGEANGAKASVNGTHASLTNNRLQAYGEPTPAPAPAPLPRPTTVAARLNGSANGSANGHHKESKTKAVEKNGQTYTNGAATAARNGHAKPVSAVLPGSSLPMAPCLPVVTESQVFQTPLAPSTRLHAVTTMNPMTTESNPQMTAGSAQLILQSQALMMQLLDLQKWQQQVALRFVDAHQQLIQQCANGSGLPALMPMMAPSVAMPQPVPAVMEPVHEHVVAVAPAPTPMVHAPAPSPVAVAVAVAPQPVAAAPVAISAAPKPVAVVAQKATVPVARMTPAPAAKPMAKTEHVNGHETARNGTAVAAPAPAPIAKVAAPVAVPAGDLPPSPEEFKDDLLQAVSERTGYPIEMLDLTLPMESGLGIDSIKTVEVFSNLKRYHRAFQDADQDEEEALKEFTNFKTLGDIIGAYELRYQAAVSEGTSGGKPSASNEGAVQRYTLQAVDAPASGEKKTTHTAS